MTFEYTLPQRQAQERAREFAAEHLLDAAAAIDRSGAIPSAVVREAAALVAGADAVAFAAAIEELAAASAAVAVAAAVGPKGGDAAGLSGLRGAPAVERPAARTRLALAAVALGIGRRALDLALADVRGAADTAPAAGGEKPHWAMADAATELDAARLLTLQAAQAVDAGNGDAAIGLARLAASRAAQLAVDAALRLAGPSGLREGALLERLARDARALSLLGGTEEDHRAAAAAGLLPRYD